LSKLPLFGKTFLFLGYAYTSWQNQYLFLVTFLYLGKINIFSWLNIHLSTKPFDFLAKCTPFGEINIFS
jgi:hypothetical protein